MDGPTLVARDSHELRVAVCVITYKRPVGLGRLLRRLQKLEFNNARVSYEIFVVDNDAAQSASSVIACFREASIPVRYFVEEKRGIPIARNRCLVEAAKAGFKYIAFIDDDEVPETTWLDELAETLQRYQCDIVAGPVLPIFDDEPPQWVIRGGFFGSRRMPTGTTRSTAGSGNVLFKMELVSQHNVQFDSRLALTGGSDTLFFRRLTTNGAHLVWCDEALVYECVPATRMCTSWLVKRAYRGGMMIAYCELNLANKLDVRLKRAIKGLVRIFYGVAMLPFSLLVGKHKLVRALQCIAYGFGSVLGTLGLTYEEYRAVHGA